MDNQPLMYPPPGGGHPGYPPPGGHPYGHAPPPPGPYGGGFAGAPPPGGYGAPPPGGVGYPTIGAPAVGMDSKPLFQITKDENLPPRETVDHDKFDIATLQDIDRLEDMKNPWAMRVELLVAVFILFNGITTIMIILTNFRRAVNPSDRDAFGRDKFDKLVTFIEYFPLFFFVNILLLFNNFFSEKTFYMYLKRGAIIDFPESGGIKYLLTSPIPLLYLLVTVLYGGVTVVTLLKFKASLGVLIIFVNNLVVGVLMTWYRQQSIEAKFVSLSVFIQSFPDRKDEYGNMDEQSLNSATKFLQNLTLTEARSPSWGGYMRNFYWKQQNVSGVAMVCAHLFVWAIMLALAGVSVAYFVIVSRQDVETRWKQEVAPCVNSCVAGLTNMTSSGFATTPERCQFCVCSCLKSFQQKDETVIGKCGDFLCPASNQKPFCSLCPTDTSCPSVSYCAAFPWWDL